MSSEKDTVDYTVRGFSRSFDRTLSDLSTLRNKPKSVILREIAEQHLTDRIKTFGQLNPLSSALDGVLARHVGAELSEQQIDNHFGTRWNMEMRDLLNISSDDDLQQILVRNTPYITVRADQVLHGHKWILKGTALWFALFAEVAFSSEEIVRRAWEKIFHSLDDERYYAYYSQVNALREMRGLSRIRADKDEFTHAGKWCQVNVSKPEHYQYGAWRVVITLTAEPNRITDPGVLSGLRFPKLPKRLIVADAKEPYGCATEGDAGEYEPGFAFVDGECRLDVYSNGEHEVFNPTGMREVAAALGQVTDDRLDLTIS